MLSQRSAWERKAGPETSAHPAGCCTYFANWKMSKTNFSILIPLGLSGLTSCPWESTCGIFF